MKLSEVLSNRVSIIIRGCINHVRFAACIVVSSITFFHILFFLFLSLCLLFMFCMFLFNFLYYVFLLFYVFLLLFIFLSVYSVSLCCSVYCFCVNVYCTTATGCQTNQLQLINISYHISYHIISYQISVVVPGDENKCQRSILSKIPLLFYFSLLNSAQY